MTDRRSAAEVLTGSALIAALGLVWPAQDRMSLYYLAVLMVFFVLFVRLRSTRRPFAFRLRCAAAALVAIPAFRGGLHAHSIWMAAVWFGSLECMCAAVRQRWMQEVRFGFTVRRLDRLSQEASTRLTDMQGRVDRVQEEITLYQTVYDLAVRQTVGMARADILSAAGESLKELERKRQLHFQSVYLFLVSGDTVDLRTPRAPVKLDARLRTVKEKILKSFQSDPGPRERSAAARDENSVALPIRYQGRLMGCLFIDLTAGSRVAQLSPMDERLLSVTADLLGLAIQNSLLYEQVNQMAITDRLTGLYVLWYFKDRLREEVQRAMRSKRPLSVLMMDLDHFKKVNDTYGHLAGDAVLREAAGCIKATLREGDLVSRYGGEEISAILPDTQSDSALRAAERIRQNIESKSVETSSEPLKVTISIGGNDLSQTQIDEDPSLTAARLLKGADEALYRAKREGRNTVRIFALDPVTRTQSPIPTEVKSQS